MKLSRELIAARKRIEELERQLAEAEDLGNADWQEHPEDRAHRLEGTAYGKRHGDEFAAAHASDLANLITVYSDREAIENLTSLRERFWARLWLPSAAESEEGEGG